MILALNVGNTHVGYGFIEGGQITATGSVPTPAADRSFELEMFIDEAIGMPRSDASEAVELVVASVVPAVTKALREVATRRGFTLIEANEDTIPIGTRPGTSGAGDDRLLNAFAASRLYGAPAIVVDVGTATTFDVVDAEGQFVGGAIAPGPGLGLDALATRTAQLPRVALALPPHALGRNTIEAIQSGTVLGHVGMVEYVVRAISVELQAAGAGQRAKVILTGGLAAHPWAAAIQGITAIDPLLTLRGLALVHAHHATRASVPTS